MLSINFVPQTVYSRKLKPIVKCCSYIYIVILIICIFSIEEAGGVWF